MEPFVDSCAQITLNNSTAKQQTHSSDGIIKQLLCMCQIAIEHIFDCQAKIEVNSVFFVLKKFVALFEQN